MRHGRVLRISAPSSSSHKLTRAGEVGVLHRQCTHHQVPIEEIGRLGTVRANAAHQASQMNHYVDWTRTAVKVTRPSIFARLQIREQPANLGFLRQIIGFAPNHVDMRAPRGNQCLVNMVA